MNEELKVLIKHMSETLDEILLVLKRPESKIGKILETAGAGVGVLSILSIIDVIRNWLGF
jgi:tRNA1(Val) A37 N6-methylase TrmN6